LREVLVSAPSRLHLGILDPSGREGRIHGGLGVALLRPRMRIRLSPSRRLEASGPLSGRAEERARAFLRKVGRKPGSRSWRAFRSTPGWAPPPSSPWRWGWA